MGLLDFISGNKDQDKGQGNGNANPSLQPVNNQAVAPPSPRPVVNPGQQQGAPAGSIPRENINTSIQNSTVNDYGTDILASGMQTGGQTVPQVPEPIPQYTAPETVPQIDPNTSALNEQTLDTSTGLASNAQNTLNPQDETIFGNGQLPDIYANKFPNATEIEPAPPGEQPVDMMNSKQQGAAMPPIPEPNQPMVNTGIPGVIDLNANQQQPILKQQSNIELGSTETNPETASEQSVSNSQVQNMQQNVTQETPLSAQEVPPMETEVQIGIQGNVQEPEKIEQTLAQPEPMTVEPEISTTDTETEVIQQRQAEPQPVEQPVQTTEEVSPEVMPVQEPITEQKEEMTVEEKVESVPVKQKKNSKRRVKKYFRKIAFIGLENADSNGLDKVTESLLNRNFDLAIDSKIGGGETVLNSSKKINKKITGVYLKPMLGKSSSPVESSENDSFSIIYSNYFEFLKHFAKDSRLFVLFSLNGVETLSIFSTLWFLNTLYEGKGKPIICVGKEWNEKINMIGQAVNMDSESMKLVHVIDNVSMLESKINELNHKYNESLDKTYIEKVVDRRVEGDEKDFIVY